MDKEQKGPLQNRYGVYTYENVFLLLLTALFFVCSTYAAELKVGVVNLDEVLQKSGLAMQLNAKISTDFQPRQDQLNAAQKKLQDSVDQLTYTAYKLSPEQRQTLQNQIKLATSRSRKNERVLAN